jgi:type I restriction enzyme S subunit
MSVAIEAPLPEFFEFIRNGMSIKQDKDGSGLPITRIETIANGTIDESRFGYAGLERAKASKWLLKRGDILFSHINSVEHIGKCAVFDSDLEVVHGMNLLCFRAKPDLADFNYIKYLFRSAHFRSQIMPFVNKAVNQASISIGNLSGIQIRIPTLEEQKRIAAILDQADALRRKRQRSLDRLNQLGQAIFVEMFGDPNLENTKIKRVRIDQVCTVSSGSTPSRGVPENYGGEIPWVKTGEVNGTIITSTEEKVTERGIKSANLRIYPRNSILIAMYGQGKTRGNVGLLSMPATTNQACAVLQANSEINAVFLFEQLKILYRALRQESRGGNQPNLNGAIVSAFPILLPEFALQMDFVSRIISTNKQIERASRQLVALDNLFTSLQYRAFKGEL